MMIDYLLEECASNYPGSRGFEDEIVEAEDEERKKLKVNYQEVISFLYIQLKNIGLKADLLLN